MSRREEEIKCDFSMSILTIHDPVSAILDCNSDERFYRIFQDIFSIFGSSLEPKMTKGSFLFILNMIMLNYGRFYISYIL